MIRKDRGRPVYDAVVLDAPPTGRIARFLNISQEISGLAKVGPIRPQSEGVMAVLRSPQTAVHLVTLLEEMPVQETLDAVAELQLGRPAGRRGRRQRRAHPAARPGRPARRRERHARPGRPARPGSRRPASTPRSRWSPRWPARPPTTPRGSPSRSAGATRSPALARPTYELPMLPDAVDLGGLYALAESLTEQGMA